MMQRDFALVLHFSAVLFVFLLSRLCHGGNTISPGQALKSKDVITSSGGNFTLGFFFPAADNRNTTFPSQKRYLGIWYTMIPEQTVVWVANRDNPIPATDAAGGSLEFYGNGDLVVLDGKGRILWKTNCSSTNDSIATLEDNGNLVLHSNSSGVIKWQSFDHPSDTLLSGMNITFDFEKGTGRLWTSWKSRNDPAFGSFAFGADPKNVLQGILWKGSVPVWRTGQWNGRSFSGIPEMSNNYGWENGFTFVPAQNGNIMFQYREPFSASSGYKRYVVKPEGQFALYSWYEQTGRWNEDWTAPVNACAMYARCGPSSVCSEFGQRTEPACHCLPGFEPSGSVGCMRSVRLGCRRDNGSSSNDGFEKVASVRPPDGVLQLVQVTNGLDECRTYCSRNCSCMGYALVDEVGCMTWLEEDLVDMQQLATGRGMDFYVRVAPELVTSPSAKEPRKILVIILSVAGSLGVILCFLCICLLRRRQAKARGLNGEILEDQPFEYASTTQERRDSGLPLFDLKAIMAATGDFSTTNKLGEGGFGPVYKGVLAGGQEIAVKRLSKSSRQGFEEFMNEVQVIAKLQHKNLVRLMGCCVQGEEKILVYEYMPNKSLDFLLFDPMVSAPLDWERRFQVVMGTARGLQYLHQESRLRVVHRDLKASNILLDERMNPRISDFGLARIFRADQTQVNTNRRVHVSRVRLGRSLLDEIRCIQFRNYRVRDCERSKDDKFQTPGTLLNLLGYAWKVWREDRITDFLDPTLGGICNSDQLLRCIKVGLLCVQEDTADRPSMSSVVLMLSGDSVNFPQLKPPAYSLRTAPGDSELHSFTDNEDPICSVNHVTVSAVEPR